MKRRTRLGLKRTRRKTPGAQLTQTTRRGVRASTRLKNVAANKIRSTTIAKARGRTALKRQMDVQKGRREMNNTAPESDDDGSKDDVIRHYIEKRIRGEETIYVKRLTHSLRVGYCRAQRILDEYLEDGKIQKTTGRGYSSLMSEKGTSSDSKNNSYTISKKAGMKSEKDAHDDGRANGKLQPQKRKRSELLIKSEDESEEYTKKLRRKAPNGTTRYFRLSENHVNHTSDSNHTNETQVSYLHSPAYLHAHAAAAAVTFKETKAMLAATPLTGLKRYQLMGKAILLKCQQSSQIIYPNEKKEDGLLAN